MALKMNELILEDGKYVFQHFSDGTFRCLRYWGEWRDFTGDKAVLSLFFAALEKQDK